MSQSDLIPAARHRTSCSICAGPKPPGPGRKLCEDCLPVAAERALAKRKEYARSYYVENREKVLARIKAQKDADPEAFRAQRAEQMRKRRAKDPEKDRLLQRQRHIKRKYGLTLEEYDAILACGCAICGTHEGRVTGKRNGHTPPPPRLCMDHDHANGKIRDALCHTCNAGIGHFADDPARLRAAADYLEKHRQ